jgi:hypothetical protein
MRTAAVASITSFALAFGGGTALAQDQPSTRGYDETLGVIGQVDSGTPPSDTQPEAQQTAPEATPSAPVAQEGDLPFTGLDVGIVLALGAVLVGAGVVLRRAATGRNHTA